MDRDGDTHDLKDDLRSTAENIAGDARHLQALEHAKARMPADDPNLVTIAETAKDLADTIAAKAGLELELAKEAAAES